MKIVVVPETRPGKYSVALFAASLCLAAAAGVVSSVQKNSIEYPNPINSPLLGTTIYRMFLAGIIAAIVGIIAVVNNNERSILVYISLLFGVLSFLGIMMLSIGNLIG